MNSVQAMEDSDTAVRIAVKSHQNIINIVYDAYLKL